MTEHKLQICCPELHREQTVYICTVDYENVHLLAFNGCDFMHAGQNCRLCREKTLALFSQDHDTSVYSVSPL